MSWRMAFWQLGSGFGSARGEMGTEIDSAIAHTVLACDGGAVTKLADPPTNRLVRVFNFKYPYEYISRYDKMTAYKEKLKEYAGV